MTDFEKWGDRYKKHWCTKEQLQRLVQLDVLSEEQYEVIVEGNHEQEEQVMLGSRVGDLEETMDVLLGVDDIE